MINIKAAALFPVRKPVPDRFMGEAEKSDSVFLKVADPGAQPVKTGDK
jgi:hypothetical protein